jgi:hypothetical protein
MEPTAVTAAPVSSNDPFDAVFSTAASVSQFIIMNAMPCHEMILNGI